MQSWSSRQATATIPLLKAALQLTTLPPFKIALWFFNNSEEEDLNASWAVSGPSKCLLQLLELFWHRVLHGISPALRLLIALLPRYFNIKTHHQGFSPFSQPRKATRLRCCMLGWKAKYRETRYLFLLLLLSRACWQSTTYNFTPWEKMIAKACLLFIMENKTQGSIFCSLLFFSWNGVGTTMTRHTAIAAQERNLLCKDWLVLSRGEQHRLGTGCAPHLPPPPAHFFPRCLQTHGIPPVQLRAGSPHPWQEDVSVGKPPLEIIWEMRADTTTTTHWCISLQRYNANQMLRYKHRKDCTLCKPRCFQTRFPTHHQLPSHGKCSELHLSNTLTDIYKCKLNCRSTWHVLVIKDYWAFVMNRTENLYATYHLFTGDDVCCQGLNPECSSSAFFAPCKTERSDK